MTLFSGLPVDQVFEEITLEDCPPCVLDTVYVTFESAPVEKVLAGRSHRNACYIVEVKISNTHVSKLQISGDGFLLSRLDGLRESELPRTVQSTVTDFLEAGARFDTADRVYTSNSKEFHVELHLEDNLDLHLFLDESGALLRQHEVGDF